MTYTKEQIAAHIDHRANCIGEDSKDVRILRQLVSQVELADAIIDAMPSMVQPLVWMRNGNHWAGGYGCVVRKIGAMYVMTVRNKHDRQFEALDEAKAAAQAHHVATILSAFGVQG